MTGRSQMKRFAVTSPLEMEAEYYKLKGTYDKAIEVIKQIEKKLDKLNDQCMSTDDEGSALKGIDFAHAEICILWGYVEKELEKLGELNENK